MPGKFYAVWDEARSRFTVGRGLIFLEEINVMIREKGLDDVTFVWCSERQPPDLFELPRWGKGIAHYPDIESACRALGLNGDVTWGIRNPELPCSWDESLLYLQHKCGKSLPALQPLEKWCQQARSYIREVCQPDIRCVVLHLKQSGNNMLSNANLSEWKKFIQMTSSFPAKLFFIVVGNESPGDVLELPNVKWTGGKNLCFDLALIHLADLFMGMASGLCQMAMFNTKPYAVFKHPGHHTEEMKREFSSGNNFVFSNERQHFLIDYDRGETILAVFQSIM